MRLIVKFGTETVLFPAGVDLAPIAQALQGAQLVREEGGFGGKPTRLILEKVCKIAVNLVPKAIVEAQLRAGEEEGVDSTMRKGFEG